MPSPPILDIEALLAPIPGENPAGKDVRYDGTHDAIKEARRADDDSGSGRLGSRRSKSPTGLP